MNECIGSFNQTADRTGIARAARTRVSISKGAAICVCVCDSLSPLLASALLCVRASFSPTVNGLSVCGRESGSATGKERGIFPQQALGGKIPERILIGLLGSCAQT